MCLKKKNTTNYIRNSQIKIKYGITHDKFLEMSELQNNLCKICGSSETGYQTKYLYIDHDHKTNKIRGLLCNKCNFGLGNFKDSVEILQKAINYLKENE